MERDKSARLKLHQAVCFAILMENNNGIIEKAPSYVWEKFGACFWLSRPEELLDERNLAKFNAWCETWEKD